MFGFHWQEDTRKIYSINTLSLLQAFVAIFVEKWNSALLKM
jgi:hypothetical protein